MYEEFLEHFKTDEYFTYDADTKLYCQKILFLEYLEEWDRLRFLDETTHSLQTTIMSDMYIHLYYEHYETVQLYKDTLERYQLDLEKL